MSGKLWDERFDNLQKGYSKLMVLSSVAGYYVGTIYTDEDGFQEPGSRESGYFKTREDAENYLEYLHSLGEENSCDSSIS